MAVALLLSGILAAQPRARLPAKGRARFRYRARCRGLRERTNEFRVSLRAAAGSQRVKRHPTRGSTEHGRYAPRALDEQGARSVETGNATWEGRAAPCRTRSRLARNINRTMVRRRLNPDVQRQWDAVRRELNRLAEASNCPGYGGNRDASYGAGRGPDRGVLHGVSAGGPAGSRREGEISNAGCKSNYIPTKLSGVGDRLRFAQLGSSW